MVKKRGRKKKPVSQLAESTRKQREYQKKVKGKKPGPGSGRFQALEKSLEGRKGIRSPGAIAAKAGIKKYGQAQMTKWAVAGRKKAAAKRKRTGTTVKRRSK
jgi:hypothetical protein